MRCITQIIYKADACVPRRFNFVFGAICDTETCSNVVVHKRAVSSTLISTRCPILPQKQNKVLILPQYLSPLSYLYHKGAFLKPNCTATSEQNKTSLPCADGVAAGKLNSIPVFTTMACTGGE